MTAKMTMTLLSVYTNLFDTQLRQKGLEQFYSTMGYAIEIDIKTGEELRHFRGQGHNGMAVSDNDVLFLSDHLAAHD